MRVLHVNELSSFKGGVERIMHDTARGLTLSGHPQALLHVDSQVDVRLQSAFDLVTTDFEAAVQFKPDRVLIHRAEPRLIEKLLVRFPTFRMVHDHDLVCLRRHKYFPLSKRVCNKPAGLSCIAHGCFVVRNQTGPSPIAFASLSEKLDEIQLNQRLEAVLVGSRWMKASLARNGFDLDRVKIVPPIPASLDLPQTTEPVRSSRTLLYVGQIIRGKGIDLMLRALADLQGDWRAIFAGEGNFISQAKALAKTMGIDRQVQFVGQVQHEELNQYYRDARAVVVPSRWPEPFGMVGVEAMVRARPVIGFAVGGIPDWLHDRENGLLVPEADIAGLTLAMQRLLDDHDYATSLGEGALQSVKEQYSHNAYLGEISEVLRLNG